MMTVVTRMDGRSTKQIEVADSNRNFGNGVAVNQRATRVSYHNISFSVYYLKNKYISMLTVRTLCFDAEISVLP